MPEATATRMTSIWALKPSSQGEAIIHSPSTAWLHSSQARGTNMAPSDAAIRAKPTTTLLAVGAIWASKPMAQGDSTNQAPTSALSGSCQCFMFLMAATSCRNTHSIVAIC